MRHGTQGALSFGLLALATSALALPATARSQGQTQAQPIAIVVDRDNPANDVSVEELRSLYLGKRREWPDGTRAVPVDVEPGSARRAFLSAFMRMTEVEYERYWVDQKVRGLGTGPRRVSSAALAVRLVARVRGAVGFVPLSRVDGSVKVLTVGGIAPDQPGYPVFGGAGFEVLARGEAVASIDSLPTPPRDPPEAATPARRGG